MIMLVMVIVFPASFVFDIDHYPVYLIIGQTIYNYVNNATVHAIYSVTDNGALLKKVYVPKYIFPLSKVTSDLVDFLFSLGAMVLVMLILRDTVFRLSDSAAVCGDSDLCVFFGNGYVSGTGIRIFPGYPLYLQCIPYGMDVCNTNFLSSHDAAGQDPVDCDTHLNPLYYYIEQFRVIVLERTVPSMTLVSGVVSYHCYSLLFGILTFRKSQDKFILYI